MGPVRHMVLEELSQIRSVCRVADTKGAFYLLVQMDTLPIRHDLAEALMAVRPEGAGSKDRVFRAIPEVATLHRDLREAGIAPMKNGVVIDSHALRHSYATRLADSNVMPRTAQELMRHTDFKQTMSVYVHPRIADSSRAIEQLPELLEESEKGREAGVREMTGTDGPVGRDQALLRRSTSAPVREGPFGSASDGAPLKDP